MNHPFVWIVAAATILLILIRPRKVPEAAWACAGALILLAAQAISLSNAYQSVTRGSDVYLFLAGMMILAELGRREGMFDWVAAKAVELSKGSGKRLFVLIYAVGVLVTVLLSNDATAVVLTPAVLAVVKRARAVPLPYLLACAFVANAASFALPISNPANIVVFGRDLPTLPIWLRTFGVAAAIATVCTFVLLRTAVSSQLKGKIEPSREPVYLSPTGKSAALGIGLGAIVLLASSSLGLPLGPPTIAAALVALALVTLIDRSAPGQVIKAVPWQVIPLVAGLFVIVAGLQLAGASQLGLQAIHGAMQHGPTLGPLMTTAEVAIGSNVFNNLPLGLVAGEILRACHSPAIVKNAVLIGIDLGPNLSVTGSLSTILWLVAIRREGEDIPFTKFLVYGLCVMPITLVLTVLYLVITSST